MGNGEWGVPYSLFPIPQSPFPASPKQRQRHRKLGVGRRDRLDAGPRPRMIEREAPRMQQHAVDAHRPERAVVAAVAMAAVTGEMVEGMLEVAPDLPEPAGARVRAQPRIARGGEAGGRYRQLAGG